MSDWVFPMGFDTVFVTTRRGLLDRTIVTFSAYLDGERYVMRRRIHTMEQPELDAARELFQRRLRAAGVLREEPVWRADLDPLGPWDPVSWLPLEELTVDRVREWVS